MCRGRGGGGCEVVLKGCALCCEDVLCCVERRSCIVLRGCCVVLCCGWSE